MKTKVLSIRMDEKEYRKYQLMAEAEGKSLSKHARELLDRALKKEETTENLERTLKELLDRVSKNEKSTEDFERTLKKMETELKLMKDYTSLLREGIANTASITKTIKSNLTITTNLLILLAELILDPEGLKIFRKKLKELTEQPKPQTEPQRKPQS